MSPGPKLDGPAFHDPRCACGGCPRCGYVEPEPCAICHAEPAVRGGLCEDCAVDYEKQQESGTPEPMPEEAPPGQEYCPDCDCLYTPDAGPCSCQDFPTLPDNEPTGTCPKCEAPWFHDQGFCGGCTP